MSGDNVIKVMKIRREGFTEYRAEVSSAFAMPDFESHISDEFVAAKLANQLREFVNASVLGECIEVLRAHTAAVRWWTNERIQRQRLLERAM